MQNFDRKTGQTLRVITESGDVVVIKLVFIKNMHKARIGVEVAEGAEVIEDDNHSLKSDPFGQSRNANWP